MLGRGGPLSEVALKRCYINLLQWTIEQRMHEEWENPVKGRWSSWVQTVYAWQREVMTWLSSNRSQIDSDQWHKATQRQWQRATQKQSLEGRNQYTTVQSTVGQADVRFHKSPTSGLINSDRTKGGRNCPCLTPRLAAIIRSRKVCINICPTDTFRCLLRVPINVVGYFAVSILNYGLHEEMAVKSHKYHGADAI